uniref:MOB kinase activator 1A n=1 Tax=Mus musculus TaxID=10090 RepID=A0A0N4SUR8_MOUSE
MSFLFVILTVLMASLEESAAALRKHSNQRRISLKGPISMSS